LVLFEESTRPLDPARHPPAPRGRAGLREDTSRIAGFERDLSETRDYLQYVQEHQEVATEELQAANEEGQSANEELQSLNEELETSKEELESTNEELTTVNDEMVNRNTELNRLNAELGDAREHAEAIIRTVAMPLLTLTTDLRVQSANEAFVATFQMAAADLRGRPLLEAEEGAWNFAGLGAMLRDVIARDGLFDDFAVEATFRRLGPRSLLLNARLLNEAGGKAKEILLGIQDVTERKRGEEALLEARSQLAQHASRLERLVAARTAELTAANRELQGSVTSIKRGQEEYRALLGQSEIMQQQLRHLTHKILTAQEEERKEISRELHDEVVQTLIGINVELSALSKMGAVSAEILKDKVGHTQRLVETSVNAVHRFARGLRPAVLDDLGLIPALHAYSRSFAAKGEIKIKLTAFGGVEALGDAERTVLFRVAQEALTNVGRHANATEVHLSITQVGKTIRMEIKDNGKSFHVGNTLAKNNNKRLGLVGMNERIEMIGGTLVIESAPGQGTTVRAEIPFNLPKAKK
jgi:signal transduction histidine kinase